MLFNGGSGFIIAKHASASVNTTFNSGAFINMGVTPQTNNNGFKPYGMLYDLIMNYGIEVSWVIDGSKAKDGTDFTYNASAYKGGPFVIRAEDISSSVATRITYWTMAGLEPSNKDAFLQFFREKNRDEKTKNDLKPYRNY
jgi:hypothetical protein